MVIDKKVARYAALCLMAMNKTCAGKEVYRNYLLNSSGK